MIVEAPLLRSLPGDWANFKSDDSQPHYLKLARAYGRLQYDSDIPTMAASEPTNKRQVLKTLDSALITHYIIVIGL